MKKSKYLLMLVLALAVISCTKEEPMGGDATPNQPGVVNDDAIAERGWVRIKLQEQAQPLRVGVFTRGGMNSGDTELDQVAEMLGATEVVRVFEDGGKFAERRRKHGLHLWYDVRFDESVPVSRASTEFSSLPFVEIVEPIYQIRHVDENMTFLSQELLYTPSLSLAAEGEFPFDDPMLKDQWHYNNKGGAPGFVAGADINLFEAWKIETGKPNVIVSVHDEGIAVEHEDLAAHIWVNDKEKNGAPGVDDDNNGYIDDIHGWNYIKGSGALTPDAHGTHVSGTISAVNGNGIGVSGVAGGTGPDDGVRIMGMQILFGKTFANQAPETYTYAADNGAVISQNSWTLGKTGDLPASYAAAFDYFIEHAGTDENGVQNGPMKGGIIIFAAGNAGGPTLLPAASDKVIAVAAMGPNYMRGGYSSCGPEIDIMAPGGSGATGPVTQQVLSTFVQNGKLTYSYIWGTSMACPHVSGVAGLIVSHFGKPGFTAAECKTRLLNGFKPVGGLANDSDLPLIGVGLIDAAAALMEPVTTAPSSVTNAAAKAEKNQVVLTWTVPADGNGLPVAKYYIEYTATPNIRAAATETIVLTNVFRAGEKATYTLDMKYNTDYAITVKAEDRYGNASGVVSVSVSTGNFVNKAPTVKKNIPDTSIAAPGEENVLTMNLLDYFADANRVEGDVLTYTIENSKTNVVTAAVGGEGNSLVLTPLSKGVALLNITATDLAGESIALSFKVTVVSGPAAGGSAAIVVYPNPAEDVLNLRVSDMAGANATVLVFDAGTRKVLEKGVVLDARGEGALTVTSLGSGMYSLRIKADGVEARTTFIKK